MPRQLLAQYQEPIAQFGLDAWRVHSLTVLPESNSHHRLLYTPFEHVNTAARLVLVGITPGPSQLDDTYNRLQSLLKRDPRPSTELLLQAVKSESTFGGRSMRPRLLRMLNHFDVGRRLELTTAEELWQASGSHLLHGTSVVPHAAFSRGKKGWSPFNGSFTEVLESAPLIASFDGDFAASLSELPPSSRFIGLGPTPYAALEWSVRQGIIQSNQLLGAFAHPSGSGGSAVDVYLQKTAVADLHPRDPVRYRATWLQERYEEMSQNISSLDGVDS